MVGWPVAGPFKPPSTGVSAKTIWVVNSAVEGPVSLTGRRLDGPGVAVFPGYERDPDFYEQRAAGTYVGRWDRTELVLVPPHVYEHRTEISIPSAGCWQFTARMETETVEIVQYIYADA